MNSMLSLDGLWIVIQHEYVPLENYSSSSALSPCSLRPVSLGRISSPENYLSSKIAFGSNNLNKCIRWP